MKRAWAQLFRLTIAKKLLLGFLSYGILTVLIAVIALSNLQRLNEINNRIIERDVPLVEITDKMIEALLAQELYGRRFFILRSSETEALFSKRSEEFKKLLRQMGHLPDVSNFPLDRLNTLHEEYDHLFRTGLEKKRDFSSRAFQDRDRQIRGKQEELIQWVRRISYDARKDQNEKSLETLSVGHSAFWMTAGLSIGALFLGILIALIITRNISHSINQLALSTREISGGKFDDLPEVRNQDELGDLSQAFQKMAQRLKRLEEMNLDANPLTHLPGSVAIENVLNKKLKEETPLAFCLLDLSHFKAFNDRYGYARGNEVIRAVARIVIEVVKTQGNGGAFVGHIGGDDFVVVTSPEWYEKICLAVIDSFDKMVLDFYDLEDRQRGCIQGETRQGQRVSFPVMTLAIAVVTNQYHRLQNHVQVGEIAAELKNFAKSFPHSIFVVDRRKDTLSNQTD
ncbi:MAG TPA: diguanylate cyclase [Thermodesulfobacteriota bacterium]|nr:diguanylate cyclase [Thermodesulfobacteriota bacterium]